jgi:hypothetical protein
MTLCFLYLLFALIDDTWTMIVAVTSVGMNTIQGLRPSILGVPSLLGCGFSLCGFGKRHGGDHWMVLHARIVALRKYICMR